MGVSQVRQVKDLQEAIFGSVAKKGVTGEILDVWQAKELEKKWPLASLPSKLGASKLSEWREKAGKAEEEAANGDKLRVSEKRTGLRGRMANGSGGSCQSNETIIAQIYYLSSEKISACFTRRYTGAVSG